MRFVINFAGVEPAKRLLRLGTAPALGLSYGGTLMNHQVLVPIKRSDDIEEVLPYLEDIARPDIKIVFLVPLGANRFTKLAGQLLEIQSGIPAKFSGDTAMSQALFTHRIERAVGALHDHGVHLEVKFYGGRLQSILRECIEGDASQSVIMRPRVNRARRWIQTLSAALRLAKPSHDVPVVLFHPSNIARRFP